ncbi:MAG: DsbA family protein [Kofleriaceae bacterium]|jgi:predicted DsbA family dithiol-disulfide isomerase|nr:DsbA family protein [Kofleriaceae bacterium]MBP9204647.1 DsbA family protein [Kofleriaceae bacterium]
MALSASVYSDFVCPFCFIADQASLRPLAAELELTLEYRPFQLHPEVPTGGVRLADYFGAARVPMMKQRVLDLATQLGVAGMTVPDVLHDTRRALAVAEYGRDHGQLDAVWQALMNAHWRRGEDLEDDEVLAAAARAAGLDPDRALAATTDARYQQRLGATRDEAHRRGVSGIPTVLLGERRVVGAQAPGVFRAAAQAAGARARSAAS